MERERIFLRPPVDLAEWIKQAAKDAGLSVNAWATVKFQEIRKEEESGYDLADPGRGHG